jgi:transcriptional regulator with XRE-family HTH domain
MPEKIKKVLKDLGIGKKIKKLRQEKGFTLQELSEKTGLSKGLISQIENEQVSPPISTLMKIANGLSVEISYFFEQDEPTEKITVVRKNERISSGRRGIKGNINIGYTYELLAHKRPHKHMEPFLVTFEPKERNDVIMFNHEGEEFHFVIEGKLEMIAENHDPIILEKGDSLYFDSSIPHGFRGLDGKPAKTLTVVFQKS